MTTEYLLTEIAEKNAEIAELKNKCAILGSFASKVRMECSKRMKIEVYKGNSFFPLTHDAAIRILDQANASQHLADVKADAVRDYEASLSSFAWTAEEYIENILKDETK